MEKSMGKNNGKNNGKKQWEKSMGKNNVKNQWEKTLEKSMGIQRVQMCGIARGGVNSWECENTVNHTNHRLHTPTPVTNQAQ